MKRTGNVESNKAYNPRNIKPQIPIDIDEIDSAMERFIRQKYQDRSFMADSRPGTRHNTGSTSSAEDRPPPLPPKPTRRFGFGLQKTSAASRDSTPPVSPGLSFSQDTSPPRVNKPSRVFGSSVTQSGDGLESKLATLRDMGFHEERRNVTVLKSLNGNLDKAVEALIRLGDQNPGRSRGTTPTPPAKPDLSGLSFDKTPTAASTASMNPFEALDAVAPMPQQPQHPPPLQTQHLPYGGPMSATTVSSPSNPYNPFLAQQSALQQQTYPQSQHFGQQQNLEQSFQGLQLSNEQSQQPLFPNRTGGYGQPQPPQYPQTNPFQHSFTPPPMPQVPQQYASIFQPQQSQHQPLSPTGTGNPFLKSTKSQIFAPTNNGYNPFNQQQQHQQPQPQQQQQQQYPLQHQQQPQIQAQAQQQGSNPFMAQSQQFAAQPNQWQSQQSSYQAQQQPVNPQLSYQHQQPSGFDKNSILALYNYPQLAPQPSEPPAPAGEGAPAPVGSPPVATASGSMNPFAASQGPAQSQQRPGAPQSAKHVSNESVDFAGLMGGRHSPDAFSGLSASFRR